MYICIHTSRGGLWGVVGVEEVRGVGADAAPDQRPPNSNDNNNN